MQIVTLKNNDSRNILRRCRLKCDFSTYYVTKWSLRSRLWTFQVFFSIFTLKTLASSYQKLYSEMRRVKSANRGISGVSLARHFSQTNMVTYLFCCIFRNRHWQGTFKGILKKIITYFFLFFWGITLIGQNGTTSINQSSYSVWLLSILLGRSLIITHQEKIMGIIVFSPGEQEPRKSNLQIWYKSQIYVSFSLMVCRRTFSRKQKALKTNVICNMAKQE